MPLGTTAVISDSHELANVLGGPGIEMIADASTELAAGHVLHGVFVRSRHRMGRRRRCAWRGRSARSFLVGRRFSGWPK